MTVAERLHLLHMHKHAVRGLGKAPGRAAGEPDKDAARASILRKIEDRARGRGQGLGPGERADAGAGPGGVGEKARRRVSGGATRTRETY